MELSKKMEEFARFWTEEYCKVRPVYEELARDIHDFLFKELKKISDQNPHFKTPITSGREKNEKKFHIKVSRLKNNKKPFFPKPLSNNKGGVPDMAGVRIIVYCQDDMKIVRNLIKQNFVIVTTVDKFRKLRKEHKFGYQAIHYMVKLKENKPFINPKLSFLGKWIEIQVVTILGHAWAEIEHKSYDSRLYNMGNKKSKETLRRFQAIAALLEIADREFNQLNKPRK